MTLTVGDLEEHLARRQEHSITAKLGDFTVSDDASVLTIGSEHQFCLDEVATAALTRYLHVPVVYYNHLTPDFRAQVLTYEFGRKADADTVVESLGEEVLAVHQPSQAVLPLGRVAEVVEKTFKPEDTIRRMIHNEKLFHVDVTTASHKVEFSAPDESLVGDITEAGMRFLSYPFQSEAPSVSVYAERLICMNGQTTPERMGRIALKGRTVDEVIASMEVAAEQLLGQLDDYLEKLGSTREMLIPGSPQAFAAQLAREANVSRKVLDAVLDLINQMDNPTVWDATQAFTSVANQVENYTTMRRLQALGGSLAFDAERMVERCGMCERLL